MTDVIAAIVEFPTVLFVIVIAAALVVLVVAAVRRPRDAPRRPDLVGRTCVIRTEGRDDGSAEVTDAAGATRVIRIRSAAQVRPEGEPLRSGSSALIYDYDNTGGYFVVAPLAKRSDPAE